MIDDTKAEEMAAAEDVAVEEVAVDEAAPVGLNINDLAQLRNIINVASQRGVFKAEEFSAVGEVYNKLDAFVNAIAANAEAENADAEAVEDTASAE